MGWINFKIFKYSTAFENYGEFLSESKFSKNHKFFLQNTFEQNEMVFHREKLFKISPIQTESGQMEYQMHEINFLFSLAWVNWGIDVGDPMLKMEKFCVRPRHRKQKINYVLLIFHLSRLSLYIHDGSWLSKTDSENFLFECSLPRIADFHSAWTRL